MFQPAAAALYVGADGSGNPFHYHQQTWNALLAGRKRWLLYPPNGWFPTLSNLLTTPPRLPASCLLGLRVTAQRRLSLSEACGGLRICFR